MKRCEKSRAKDKKFAVRTNRRNAANQQIPGNARGYSSAILFARFPRANADNLSRRPSTYRWRVGRHKYCRKGASAGDSIGSVYYK